MKIAERKRVSTSTVVREALEKYAAEQDPTPTPYELIKDLIGLGHGGDPLRSTDGGRKFAEFLRSRHRRRR